MLFQHTWRDVITDRKTQTRRLVKPNEWLGRYMTDKHPHWYHCVMRGIDGPIKWAVGKTYAVQPGRGLPAIIYNPDHPCYGIDIVEPEHTGEYAAAKSGEWRYRGQGYMQARIRITDIQREDVRNISLEDTVAEGFETRDLFWETWCKINDPSVQFVETPGNVLYGGLRSDWKQGNPWGPGDYLVRGLKTRPDERYQAFVLTFELVKE
jgi:hypothetical protein